MSCASVCDLVITVSLVYNLRKAKTAFGKSNYILDSIISRAVETGMLSMTCAAINAIMFTAVKGDINIKSLKFIEC